MHPALGPSPARRTGTGRGVHAALVLAYAAALRSFDPALGDAQAARLAQCAVADADAARLDARLVVALIAVESAWRPRARSRAGAVGLGQLMPSTAAALGVDPNDPVANVHGTVRHLAALVGRYAARPPAQRYALAVAAYNAGAAAVDRFGGVPPYAETRLEVRRVLDLWRRLSVG
jgi:soluble lytic murein transglycosylase-like protein